MTLRMGDGPVSNLQKLPAGMIQAAAGYVDQSGIGITYPQVVAAFPRLYHLSISVTGQPADCADVELGAMNTWAGYQVGYTSWENVGNVVARDGPPPKLWVAHYTGTPHICGPTTCGLKWQADGTQYAGNVAPGVDLSMLADDFFSFQSPGPQPPPEPPEEDDMGYILSATSAGPKGLVAAGTNWTWYGGRVSPIANESDYAQYVDVAKWLVLKLSGAEIESKMGAQ